ncbi:hypothetical protein MRX96_039208 [Rhipicephalus microplus]
MHRAFASHFAGNLHRLTQWWPTGGHPCSRDEPRLSCDPSRCVRRFRVVWNFVCSVLRHLPPLAPSMCGFKESSPRRSLHIPQGPGDASDERLPPSSKSFRGNRAPGSVYAREGR